MQGLLEFFKSEVGKTLLASLWLALEYWLGKTEKVKSGSVLELVINGVKSVFFKKKEADPSGNGPEQK